MTHINRRSKRIPAFILTQRPLIGLFCVLALLAYFPHTAYAHPMGNFSTNRYSRVEVGAEEIELLYIVDMAEIPTHAERSAMDTDNNGVILSLEEERYLAGVAAALPAQLLLVVDGEEVAWTLTKRILRFVPGQANLPTLRMEFVLIAPLPARGIAIGPATKDVQALRYVDTTYEGRVGWKEIIVVPAAGIELLASDVPQSDLSNQLQAYPVDLLQTPPASDGATVSWQRAVKLSDPAAQQSDQGAATGATVASLASDGFAELVSIELGAWAVTLALLAAFGWGAAHALSPGHGKTIVAAYLVGARGTFAHALFLGATTTITHTLGVFVLGAATLVASQYFLPERIYPWLSTISGVLVIAIGVSIGWNRLRALLRGEPLDHHHHEHSDDHHHHGDHHHHDHAHARNHDRTHSHMPPHTDGSAVTWRGLLALGISGGLLPCPSALVVLLGAIALGRVAFGLLLILMFSLGLATVLTAFGLLLLRAGKWFERIPESSRYARYLAVASAAFITLVGAGITLRALMETGILSGLV